MRLGSYSLSIVVLQLILSPYAFGGDNYGLKQQAFRRGESLTFLAAYNSRITGNVVAGEARLEVIPGSTADNGAKTMHLVAQAHTRGLFNLFFKVENRYDSYLNEENLLPLRFVRNIREGRYRRLDDVFFDREMNLAYSPRDTISIPPDVQDVISLLYFVRTLNLESAMEGDFFTIPYHLSDSVYMTRILFEGREQITTGLGTFHTFRLSPQVEDETIFGHSYPMTFWFSADENKIPLLIESALVVGSLRLELKEYKGLRNELRSRVR